MISFIMEEKVVRPPRNPVTRKAEARGGGEVLGEKEGEETDQERAGSIDEERAIGEAASQKGGGKQCDGVSRECAQCAA